MSAPPVEGVGVGCRCRGMVRVCRNVMHLAVGALRHLAALPHLHQVPESTLQDVGRTRGAHYLHMAGPASIIFIGLQDVSMCVKWSSLP